MKNPTIKMIPAEKAVFDLSFAYECLDAKVVADADPIDTPTRKNGSHPIHLKGRDLSMKEKRYGAEAKKRRKQDCGSRKAESFDACSYRNGGEFTAKKRSTLIEEDYDPEVEMILEAYNAADIGELLVLSEEAWIEATEFDAQWIDLHREIERTAALNASHRMEGMLIKGYVDDPTYAFVHLFSEEKVTLIDENTEKLSALRESYEKKKELSEELEEVYDYLTSRRK